jgi:hypothetical protein
LEQQINSIESANINRETLVAMEKAGQAMKQIHNGLTPEKVDETMYVIVHLTGSGTGDRANAMVPGTNCGTKTPSARRLSTPSPTTNLEKLSTTRNWRGNWSNYNRRRWTSRL